MPKLASRVGCLVNADLGRDSLSRSELDTFVFPPPLLDSIRGKLEQGDRVGSVKDQMLKGWSRKAPLSSTDKFDIISCQFAMHYMMETAETANHFFSEISAHLAPGGLFIATTTDGRVMAELLAESICGGVSYSAEFSQSNSSSTEPGGGGGGRALGDVADASLVQHDNRELSSAPARLSRSRQGFSIANPDTRETIVRVTFPETGHWQRLLGAGVGTGSGAGTGIQSNSKVNGRSSQTASSSSSSSSADLSASFGIQYDFHLHDAVDSIPEWLVPLGNDLEQLVATHDMSVCKVQNFHDFFSDLSSEPSVW